MKKINFKLEKNNEKIIEKRNINSIISDSKTTFIISGIKYSYDNKIFTKETNEEIIMLNFIENKCTITLKPQNISLNLKINVLKIVNYDNIKTIEYEIETEEKVLNKITIEYI